MPLRSEREQHASHPGPRIDADEPLTLDRRLRRCLRWRDALIVLLLMANFALLSEQARRRPAQSGHTLPTEEDVGIEAVARGIALPRKLQTFRWYTPYGSTDLATASPLWDNISSAHGLIVVDHQVAAAKQWLPSMSVPGDESKGLYLLESYHQLHCLKMVRTAFLAGLSGEELDYPTKHVLHCFDALRQFVACHADATPLYTTGDHTSGNGQARMCSDWAALRDYATEHSACFRDRVGNETLREQFGHCDGGEDGMEAQ